MKSSSQENIIAVGCCVLEGVLREEILARRSLFAAFFNKVFALPRALAGIAKECANNLNGRN
jgi:hypothetical protein